MTPDDEYTPFYGWNDCLGNKYITVVDVSNGRKKMEIVTNYGSCAVVKDVDKQSTTLKVGRKPVPLFKGREYINV